MSSPFTFFRRNSHITMVGIVILSMMAFTLDAVFSQEGTHFVMLGLMMGGILFAFAGIGRGRWIHYGIAGAVFGALCGWILPDLISPSRAMARTSTIGAFDNKRISELMYRRNVANIFMQQAFEKAYGPGRGQFAPQFQFDSGDVESDLMFGEIMRAEADELKIVVTNVMVNDYIHKQTSDLLSTAQLAEIRTNLNFRGTPVTETELFDSFRNEIKARMAYQLLNPLYSSVTQPPEVYFEMFRRTRVTQRLNTVRLDVDAFVPEVPNPSDAEVASLFAEYRLKFPGMDEPGSPGFRQERKAKLAYLELDYKTVEQASAPPTDEEIEAYYNEKKDLLYRKQTDATSDESSAIPSNAAPAEGNTEPSKSPDSEPKAEGDAPSKECFPFSADEESADAKPVAAGDESKSPAAVAPETTQPGLEIPQQGDDTGKPDFEIPKVEYQPLDDDLKTEIRDRLLDEKVRKIISERMAEVMVELRLIEKGRAKARKLVVDANPGIQNDQIYEKMQDHSKTMIDSMKAVAEKHGCKFVETPLVTFRELNEGEMYPIGAAAEPASNPFMQAGPTVAQQVFTSFPNTISDDTNLFVRHQSVKNAFDLDGGEVHFAWWVVEFSESHVPKLDDPGIRDQVVLTWKRSKARDLARKRADELKEIVQKGLDRPEAERQTISASLEGQTVTGKPDSPALLVRQTQTFSWIEQFMTPQMNFMQQRPTLRLSSILFADEVGGVIRNAGNKFMKAVFEEIESERVGVVPNDDLSSFFVVQPVERSADDDILRQQFLTEGKQSGFQQGVAASLLNAVVANPVSMEWERSIWAKYKVDRDTLPAE